PRPPPPLARCILARLRPALGHAERALRSTIQRLVALHLTTELLPLAPKTSEFARRRLLSPARARLHRLHDRLQRPRLQLVAARDRHAHPLARRLRGANAAPRFEQQGRKAARGLASAPRLGS